MHPDTQVAVALHQASATRDAEHAALRLFRSWDDLARFFAHVFTGLDSDIAADLDRGHLATSYPVSRGHGQVVTIQPSLILHYLASMGLVGARDGEFLAEFCRVFLTNPVDAVNADGDTWVAAFDAVQHYERRELAVFEDFSIHRYLDRRHATKCLRFHRLPVEYVRGVWGGELSRVVTPDTVYELHRHNVPASFARTAMEAHMRFAAARAEDDTFATELHLSARSIGPDFQFIAGEFIGSDVPPAGFHALALYRAGVSESYIVGAPLRTSKDIIDLFIAGVPASYVSAVHFTVPVPAIIGASERGIPEEYLAEVMA